MNDGLPRVPSDAVVSGADAAAAPPDRNQFATMVVDRLFYSRGALPEEASHNDWYLAVAYAIRDRMIEKRVQTARTVRRTDVRVVAYMSAEFLLGPHLASNMLTLGMADEVRGATELLGLD